MKLLIEAVGWLLIGTLLAVVFAVPGHAATTLLPNGEQCFQQSTGPVSSGSVNMYFPGTTTPKATWADSGQVSQNTQPLQLDANGCAIIYGVGSYRQQLWSGPVVNGVTTGNLIFDLTTTDTSAYNETFWAGTASGTPNAITITDTGFSATDGVIINFSPIFTNTGPTTLNPSGFGNINVVKDTTAGPVSLSGGEIVCANGCNVVSVVYRAFDNQFHILNPVIQSVTGSSAPLCGAVGYQVVNTGGSANTELTVTANNASMVSATGLSIQRSGVSVIINTAVVGANGLDTGSLASSSIYYVYLIDNGSAPAALMSLSSTSPTLPTGYTFSCRLSADFTDSSTHLGQIVTLGRRTTFSGAVPSTFMNATIQGTCFSTATALTFSLLPPTVEQVVGVIAVSGAQSAGISDAATITKVFAGATEVSGVTAWFNFVVPITTAQTVYYCSSATANNIRIIGWDDNVNAQ